MLLDIAPGAEWLFPFAKKKLEDLKRSLKRTGLSSDQQILTVDTGETISISTSFGQDKIRITGAPLEWWVDVAKVQNPDAAPADQITLHSRRLATGAITPTRFVGPKDRANPYEVPFNPVRRAFARNASDEVQAATTGDGLTSTVWVGWLSKYQRGGFFTTTHPVAANKLFEARLSRDGKRVVLIRWSATFPDYSIDSTAQLNFMQKADVEFVPSAEPGQLTTNATFTTLLPSGIRDGFQLSRPHFDRAQTTAYCFAINDAGDAAKVYAVDLDSATVTVVLELSYPGRVVSQSVLRADETGRPWLALQITNVAALTITTEVYRGADRVFERTVLEPTAVGGIGAHQFDATSEDGDTFACVLREGTSTRPLLVHGNQAYVGNGFPDGYTASAPIVRGDGLVVLVENAADSNTGAPRILYVRSGDHGSTFSQVPVIEAEGANPVRSDQLRAHRDSMDTSMFAPPPDFNAGQVVLHRVARRALAPGEDPNAERPWVHTTKVRTCTAPAGATAEILEKTENTKYWR